MDTLTERRKADRVKMADRIHAICAEHGVATEREGATEMYPHRILVRVNAPRGLCASIDFDGKSCQPDIHIVAWHIDGRHDTRLADLFGYAAGGFVNEFHFSKCTAVQYGFEALCDSLVRVLTMANDGTAFSAEREARMIAKNGRTAAERSAQFAKWMAEQGIGQ